MIARRHFLAALAAASAPALRAEGERLRIGQIGTRHAHAAGKCEAVRQQKDTFEIVGIAEAEHTAHPAYAGIPRMSEETLLQQPGLRAVLVETAVEASCETAHRAIRAGKHVHLDKPGALEHAPFARMRREAADRGLTVQMGYMLRYNPAFQLLFHAHREGWLGDILEIDAMMGKLADAGTRKTIGALAGGGMFELACHLIDAVVTLLGKPLEVHAFCTPSRVDEPVKDNQLAVLVYPKATVNIRCNHADPFGGPRRRFQVAGTKGALEIQPLESGKALLSLSEARGPWSKGTQALALPLPRGRYDAEFEDLAAVLRGQKAFAWNAEHDIAVHETVLRAAGMSTV